QALPVKVGAAAPVLVSSNALLAEKQNKYQGQQKRKAHKRGNLVCRYAAHWGSYLPQRMVFEQQQLNCSFLLAVRSELLEEAPQIFGLLLVLNPRKHHFGAWNLRPGIFDVFLEGRFVPDDPGIFVRIRVIVAWHRACVASFQAVLDWADRGSGTFAYVMAGYTFLERFFSRGDISSNGRSRRGRERDNRNRNPLHHSA